jgi:hypothetical protein
MRAATVVTALVLLSTAGAFAQDAPARKRPPRQGERRTTLTTVDLQSLPAAVSLPAVLDESKKPTSFPLSLPEATDLRFQPSDVPSYVRWKAAKSGSIYGRLEPTNGVGSIRPARDILQGYNRGPTFSVGCSNDGGAPGNLYRLMAIRWERIQTSPGGAVTLEISDGWFDGRDCKAYVERKSTFPLRPVLSHEETPVLFASRTEDGLLLHFPPTARVVSDASGGTTSPASHGSLWSVLVPIRKGQASSVLAEMNPRDVASWLASLQAKPIPPQANPVPHRQLQIGVEVLQAVRDEAPTILVRSTI